MTTALLLAYKSFTSLPQVTFPSTSTTPTCITSSPDDPPITIRATSTADGVGIAWALSEYFISLGTFTLFATHFGRLTALAGLYPNARLWHLEVDTSRERLDFRWHLQPGGKEGTHYGLLLAQAVAFPEQVLAEARRVVSVMDREDARRRRAPDADSIGLAAATALYSLAHKVACIAHAWSAKASINAAQQLQQLQREARALVSPAANSSGS